MAEATERSFLEGPLPKAVALDADFVISVLNKGEQFHQECLSFAERLSRSRAAIVYSPLLRLEFLHGWFKAINTGGVTVNLLQQRPLLRDAAHVRELLLKFGDDALTSFLNQFDQYEVRLTVRLHNEVGRAMAEHRLRPMDACLVAAARRTQVNHIVSLDRDFQRVDGIDLWNNHIPSKRKAARR